MSHSCVKELQKESEDVSVVSLLVNIKRKKEHRIPGPVIDYLIKRESMKLSRNNWQKSCNHRLSSL